ncbi:serine/threonine-protein kinase [Tautonia plasticadhaerens]|uniref:non-specific serine/threonine protein kinase n=1 Tax=Tautonia plasticadhaerens TaxID=2527974 RepID=A0A518H6M9_9BACT|nr:serine/threonine-protein kinase [Tautonia plasticadhaerens]QDV36520.1 Serine/threonine-protein kinase PrkC [Tautonia plasticadhaerens]
MSTDPSGERSLDRRVDEAIAEYLAAEDLGLSIDRDAYLARHPDLADELGAFLDDHDGMARLAPGRFPGAAPERTIDLGEASGPGEAGEASPAPTPARCGDYDLLGEVARGGMGVVYRASHRGLNKVVALKMILDGPLASGDGIRRFRAEAEALAVLDHPHIVPVFDVGQAGSHHYFVMRYMPGGSLADRLARGPVEPEEAARLAHTIARAVHHAHRRGILHRDLKPSNILLDAEGRPSVSDFGLAKRIGDLDERTATGAIVGSPSYMAPEQAEGSRSITVATDVYGLGAILFALLTGRPPFRSESVLETIRQVRECDPEPPASLNRRVDRDLETICLRCLAKDPDRRYESADDLADDLGRWLRGEPIRARRVGRAGRLALWCRRHPAASSLGLLTAVSLVATTLAALSLARAREAMLVREVGMSNRYAARHVASTILRELEHLGRPVAEAAGDPELIGLLTRDDREGLQRYVERRERDPFGASDGRTSLSGESPYATWFVLDRSGVIRGESPRSRDVVGRDFGGRDYVRGAIEHADRPGSSAVHVSLIFKSENDGMPKFALAAPVRPGPGGPPIGVVAATVTTRAELEGLRLDDRSRIAVLVGRVDPEPPRSGAEPWRPGGSHVILRHPAYAGRGVDAVPFPGALISGLPGRSPGGCPGREFRLPGPEPEGDDASAIDDDYADPLGRVDPRYRGRWIAGLAPVGGTELAVVIQRRFDEAVDPDRALTIGLSLGVATALTLAILLLGAAAVVLRGRRARPGSGGPGGILA